MVQPNQVKAIDTLEFCKLLKIDKEDFIKRLQKAEDYAPYLASVFLKQLAKEDFAFLQEKLHKYTGFFIQKRIIRDYPIKAAVTGRPNSGTVTLLDLLSFDLKELRLFGLDFFRTLYDVSYLKEGGNIEEFERLLATNPDRHDPDSQYLFFKNKIYPNDDRIKIDDYFKEILGDPSYDKMYFTRRM